MASESLRLPPERCTCEARSEKNLWLNRRDSVRTGL
jgi:hypothetical protein